MAKKRKQYTKPRSERRKGVDRRNGSTQQDAKRIQVLLAQLIGVFLGTLVGFLLAYIISDIYIAPFRELTDNAQAILTEAQTELEKIEPEFNTLRTEYTPLRDQWEKLTVGESTKPVIPTPKVVNELPDTRLDDGEAAAGPGTIEESTAETNAIDSPEPGAGAAGLEEPSIEDQLADFDRDHYFEVRDNFNRLKAKRQRLNDQISEWNKELESYRYNENLLNLLGIGIVLVCGLVGYLFYPLILRDLLRISDHLRELSSGLENRTVPAIVGFFAGLVIAVVVILAVFSTFSSAPILEYSWFRLLFGAFLVIVLGLVGSLIGITYFGAPRQEIDPYEEFRLKSPPKILDTSVVIDGRIHEVAAMGFLDDPLVVTNSVLRELQLMADSNDERKRNKGRRGLELVRKMQDDPRLDVMVFDDSSFDSQAKGTDEQLIVVAQAIGGRVVTNDYQLNRVASIRDVRVINVNALANAVKTKHVPGDYLEIEIIDQGRQQGQGVGYLDDGTMVVVEDGEPFINKYKLIKITSVTQTAQGRMLFGRVDAVEQEAGGNER